MKYRKKPVEIEAIQFDGKNELEIKEFVGDSLIVDLIRPPQNTEKGIIPKWVELTIKTLEGDMKVNIGDYVIKGVKGEFYPCKPDIFEMTYEKVGKGGRMSDNDTYINFIRNKEAQRKDKDNIFCTGISNTEFVKFAIKYLLGNDWYVVDPLGHSQITQLALEDILFKYSKQFKKEYKEYKKQRSRKGERRCVNEKN